MIKTLYIVLTLLLFVPLIGESAFAQPAQAKQTGNASRLLAMCDYSGSSGNFIPGDSVRYIYPNLTTTSYSQIKDYIYSGGIWSNGGKLDYFYNSAGLVKSIQTSLWNTATNNYDIAYNDTLIFDAAGNVVQEIIIRFLSSPPNWTNYDQWSNIYNAQNKLIRRDELYSGGSVNVYYRTDYYYDASGVNFISSIASTLNGNGVWDAYLKDFYTNNAAGKPLRDSFSRILPNGNWRPYGLNSFSYDARGNQTFYLAQGWDTVTAQFDLNSSKSTRIYNSYDQIVSDSTLNWANGAWAINAQAYLRRYYYESATGISNAAAGEEALLIITPNPASDALHLSVKWDAAQSFNATITDIQGRVYQTFSAPAAKEFSTVLSLTNLPSGNYNLHVAGSAGGNASRMITVRH